MKLFEEGRTFLLTVIPLYKGAIVQHYNGRETYALDIVFEWLLLKHWIYLSTHTLSISTWHIFFHLSLFPTIFHENIFWGKTVFFLDGVFKVYRSGHQCVKKVTNLKTPSIWNVIFFILGHSQVQVNNYEIVVNFFHISHNLTRIQ